MKYTTILGTAISLLVLYACTLQWIYLETPDKYITGFTSTTDNNPFGKPALLHFYFLVPAILLFITPRIWAKRVNFIFGALNVAWAIRNFFAIGMTCRVGICPTKLTGIWIIFVGSIIIFILTLVPKIALKPSKES